MSKDDVAPGENRVTAAGRFCDENAAKSALVGMVFIVGTVIGVVWFFYLAKFLLFLPGAVLAEKADVLFNSDTSFWLRRVNAESWYELSITHPLRPFIWGYLARFLKDGIALFDPNLPAAILATNFLNSVFCGLGIGALLAWAYAVRRCFREIAILAVCLLSFSSNVILAAPDHSGISFGLMAFGIVSVTIPISRRSRVLIQATLLVLLGGTTITNAILPVMNLVVLKFTLSGGDITSTRLSSTARKTIAYSALLGAIVGTLILWLSWPRISSGESIIVANLHLRLFLDPIEALKYVFVAVVYPVVAPGPGLGVQGVTFEPISVGSGLGWFWLAALCWLWIFFVGIRSCFRRRDKVVCIGLAWMAMNVVLHTIWGDEFFLYSPHWSWVLFLVMVSALRDEGHRMGVLLGCLCIWIWQIEFFRATQGALSLI